MRDYQTAKAILGSDAETTGNRAGFYEFLKFIAKHNPTKQQLLEAVDMEYKRRDAIHEDMICVQDYLERYEGKLFETFMHKMSLTELGRKLLNAIR